ncbi:hypothetical protein OGZ51_10365 [Lactococcus lactis]|uniref:Uncharacterized protein n=1 Tax=Lactococcus lactis TaxID=1358 RepID=A0A9X4S5A8_9LACT|nr:hypothetical protein [Lactococcus lactis]MDG4984548.1 hypothetical protein [Lactococcus lactis]
MKKILKTFGILSIPIIGVVAASKPAIIKADTTSEVYPVLKEYQKTDKLLKISGNVYVHGKVTITNFSPKSKGMISLDTDTDPRAKTVQEILNGELIETVDVPNSPLSTLSVPSRIMNLGEKASAAGDWNPHISGFQYTPYAYQPVPLGTKDLLRWYSWFDSMYVGGSERWNNPISGHVIPNDGKAYVSDATGNISAAWTQTPFAEGAMWKVAND